MTTFKEIRGTAVESVSSDPSNPEVGQIWYNNSIGVLKGYQLLQLRGQVVEIWGQLDLFRKEQEHKLQVLHLVINCSNRNYRRV
jgi:hypothetical protein